MQEMAADVARHSAPWKPSQNPWVVGIEGIAALVIGIYVVGFPVDANDVIRVLIAVALLLASAGRIVEGFRFWNQRWSPWATLGGGAGAMAAALTLLSTYSLFIEPAGARQMLAVGLLTFGVIELFALLFTFRSNGFSIAAFIIDALAIALGILLLQVQANDTSGTRLLGIAAIIGGVALLLYAYILWSTPRRAARQQPVASGNDISPPAVQSDEI